MSHSSSSGGNHAVHHIEPHDDPDIVIYWNELYVFEIFEQIQVSDIGL